MLVQKMMSRRNLEDESRFNSAVLEDNISLEQQLSYRTAQLTRAGSDKDERLRIRDEISSLKDQIVAKAFTDAYTEQVFALNEGASSISSTISWLNDRLSRTTDANIISKIKTELAGLKTQQYEQSKASLSSATEFANNNKGEDIINSQLSRVSDMRAKALLAGNDDYVAILDLQAQSLKKSLSETQISNATLQMAVMGAAGGSAITMLDAYNKQIENCDKTSPVTVGGVRYDSMEQYWSLTRSSFLNDKSDNGFFASYKSELDQKVQYKNSRGILTTDSLGEVKTWFDTLKARPEFAEYSDQIAQAQQTSLQTAADLRGNAILNEYATKSDTSKALSELSAIQDKYGVDQTTNYQKIVASSASEKKDQVTSILSTMSAIMGANPGISNEAAMSQAIASGAGASFSNEELATTKASNLITTAGKKATDQQYNENDNLTISQSQAGNFPQFQEGGLYRKPNENTVYMMENGKLRGLSGNWNEIGLKKLTGGKGYDAVKVVDNLNGLSMGASINATDYITPQSGYTENGLYKNAKDNTVYKYENGKLRGLSGAWDEIKLKEYTGGKGFSAVNVIDTIDPNLLGDIVDVDDRNTWKTK